MPSMLFATTAIESRREAITAGGIAAAASLIPDALSHLSFTAGYPNVLVMPMSAY